MSDLYAPQMVIRSRMLYFTWVPEDKDAVRALVPAELPLSDNAQCFINQYVVDSSDDTSGFEPYSLTYAGLDVKGQDSPQGIPGRWRMIHHHTDLAPNLGEVGGAYKAAAKGAEQRDVVGLRPDVVHRGGVTIEGGIQRHIEAIICGTHIGHRVTSAV